MNSEEIRRFYKETKKLLEQVLRVPDSEKTLKAREFKNILTRYKANNSGSLSGFVQFLQKHHVDFIMSSQPNKEDIKALEELSALIPDEKPVNLDEVFGRKKTDLNKVDTPTSETTNIKRLHRQETKRGFNQITYCIDYVPVNRNRDTSPEILESRNFIYSFKNGKFNQDHKTALELLINRTCYTVVDGTWIFKRSTCILPVPASTHIKNMHRYKDFLAAFCMNKKNLINGFEFIQLLFDREAKHTSETRESKVNYRIDLTSISKLGNVDIIVFDDLVTQGSTISQFLNELGGHKNKVKQIITLGATV